MASLALTTVSRTVYGKAPADRTLCAVPRTAQDMRWSGRLDSNQRPPHPQCDALPGCATPRLARASRQGYPSRQGAAGGRVSRRRRKMKSGRWVGRILAALLALPALYLVAALIGSVVPVNRGWAEAAQGTTVYLADNGVHADIIMPVKANGLDWGPLIPNRDFSAADPGARWIAFGSGARRVYLNTPTWWDLTPRTVWSALTRGPPAVPVRYAPGPR